METLAVLVHRITRVGAFVGGVFLILAMLLLISNIFGRFTQMVIPGSYEIFEMMMAIPVAFALVYAALHKTHVVVNLIVTRFPPRLNAASEILASLVSLVIWGLIFWGGAHLVYESGLREMTETLGIPYMPFRIILLFGIFLFCLTHILDMSRAFMRFLEK
ncbi:TRAP transporter small permease [Thermodesulfobacteriota bacterium]